MYLEACDQEGNFYNFKGHPSPQPHWDFSPYISLYNHPGVGQTHVALGAKQLQPLLQIPLSVVIDLKKQTGKNIFT